MGSKVEGTETSILCVFIDARLMVISDPQNNLQSTREENQHDILEQRRWATEGWVELSCSWELRSRRHGCSGRTTAVLTSNFENL